MMANDLITVWKVSISTDQFFQGEAEVLMCLGLLCDYVCRYVHATAWRAK